VIAEPLYVALVTDTGEFQYTNTTPDSHRMAAELMEIGVDVHRIFHELYENVPFEKMLLLARVLERVERYDGGRLTVSFIRREDYDEFGGDESLSEGIVDYIRSIEGTTVAALVREQLKSEREGIRKVSLRTAEDTVDVSIMARQENGGGHRQAAGFSTEKSSEDLIAWLRAEIAAQVEAPTH
jgi:phosphoesterase RecJ-like protein